MTNQEQYELIWEKAKNCDKLVNLLDKIRYEIENDWELKKYPNSPFSCGLRHALEIIDKCRKDV